jgi:putative lysine decarboxylase
MPGGTMEEMMEVWTMNQLSEIDKPVGLLDIASFYQPFLASSTTWWPANSCRRSTGISICVDEDSVTLVQQCRNCVGTDLPKWLTGLVLLGRLLLARMRTSGSLRVGPLIELDRK